MAAHDPLRVLVAEDDFLVGKMIQQTLQSIGYILAAKASDGLEALELVCEVRPDVVLMDIQMAEMDGLEATRRIQECCPTPIVVLTAHESEDLVQKAGEAGVAAYLTKPPKGPEIERAITIALARHEDLMALRQLNQELAARNEDLKQALAEVKTLRGIIPICMDCKKIRNDDGFWQRVEVYVRDHSHAEFSHSYCPECAERQMAAAEKELEGW
jgi:CheY-like chemotaxis protein